MDLNEESVEISYQIISDAMEVITVAIFIDDHLLHIIAGQADVMVSKLNKLFK